MAQNGYRIHWLWLNLQTPHCHSHSCEHPLSQSHLVVHSIDLLLRPFQSQIAPCKPSTRCGSIGGGAPDPQFWGPNFCRRGNSVTQCQQIFFFFPLKFFCRTHSHVLFWGHWYPCFGFLVTSPLVSKPEWVLPYSHCGGECNVHFLRSTSGATRCRPLDGQRQNLAWPLYTNPGAAPGAL